MFTRLRIAYYASIIDMFEARDIFSMPATPEPEEPAAATATAAETAAEEAATDATTTTRTVEVVIPRSAIAAAAAAAAARPATTTTSGSRRLGAPRLEAPVTSRRLACERCVRRLAKELATEP